MDAFNTYRGTASGNQLLVSDLAYYKLALATAESEAQEFEFDEKDNSMDIATQNHGLGMGINDTSTSTWHPVFGPGYTRPAPRSYAPSLLNWHVDLERTAGQQKALPFYCSGTSARLSRAPTFGSSDAFDCESVSDTLNDDNHFNVSDKWVIHQSRSFGVSREEMVMTKKEDRGTTITNCTALINHNHSCTAPMDLFPASPALSSVSTLTLIPTPMKTGIEYTGPVPSEMMEKVLNEHINADVENANAETASQKKKRVCEFRIVSSLLSFPFLVCGCADFMDALLICLCANQLVAIVAFYVTLSIMAFAGAIVIATQKDQTNCDGSCSGKDLF